MDKRIDYYFDTIKWMDTPIFIYKKEGIVLNKGKYKGFNLSQNYIGNECEITEMLDRIADEGSRHIKNVIKMVKEDLNDIKRNK